MYTILHVLAHFSTFIITSSCLIIACDLLDDMVKSPFKKVFALPLY